MKKQPQLTAKTKENLRAAFWKLYTQKSIEKITIKEITDLAGYNRGTFYLYYKDVYDIFSQIEEELLAVTMKVLETAKENEELDFTKHMSMIMEMAQKYSPYVSVLLGDHGDNNFSVKLKEMIWPLLEPYLIQQTYTSLEKEIISEFYMSGLLAAISRWLQDDTPMPIDQFIEFVLSNIFSFSKV